MYFEDIAEEHHRHSRGTSQKNPAENPNSRNS